MGQGNRDRYFPSISANYTEHEYPQHVLTRHLYFAHQLTSQATIDVPFYTTVLFITRQSSKHFPIGNWPISTSIATWLQVVDPEIVGYGMSVGRQ